MDTLARIQELETLLEQHAELFDALCLQEAIERNKRQDLRDELVRVRKALQQMQNPDERQQANNILKALSVHADTLKHQIAASTVRLAELAELEERAEQHHEEVLKDLQAINT